MKWALPFDLHYFHWKIMINQGCTSHVEGCKLQAINSCFIICIYAWVPCNQNSPLANANCLIEKNYISIVIDEVLTEGFYWAILKYDIFFSNAFDFMGRSIACVSKLPLWQIDICGKCGSSMSHMPVAPNSTIQSLVIELVWGCNVAM